MNLLLPRCCSMREIPAAAMEIGLRPVVSQKMQHCLPSMDISLPLSSSKGELLAFSPLRQPRRRHWGAAFNSKALQLELVLVLMLMWADGRLAERNRVTLHNSEQLGSGSTSPPQPTVSRRTVLQTAITLCSSTEFLASETKSHAAADDDFAITRKVFFDIAIDGEPIGEVVVGLYGADVPIGAQRFAELAVGQRGIGYRRKEFGKVTPTYIQNNGLRSFSLSGGDKDEEKITGGKDNLSLAAEMAELDKKGTRPKNVTGAVSLFVVDPNKPPPKPKLIAKDGKFVYLEEESRPDPNATEFMIVTADTPQLDSSNLVVGRVIEGYDVIKQISAVRVVNENSSSPYFQTAKLIGDSRAVVAEKGFYRPYSKILITKSGEIREQPKVEQPKVEQPKVEDSVNDSNAQ